MSSGLLLDSYRLSAGDYGHLFVGVTSPLAHGHWNALESDHSVAVAIGHFTIALIESVPLLGGLAALVELAVARLFAPQRCAAPGPLPAARPHPRPPQAGGDTDNGTAAPPVVPAASGALIQAFKNQPVDNSPAAGALAALTAQLVNGATCEKRGDIIRFDVTKVVKPSPRCLIPVLLGYTELTHKTFSSISQPVPEVPNHFYLDLKTGYAHIGSKEICVFDSAGELQCEDINNILLERTLVDFFYAFAAEDLYIAQEEFVGESFSVSRTAPKTNIMKIGCDVKGATAADGVYELSLDLRHADTELLLKLWGSDDAAVICRKAAAYLHKQLQLSEDDVFAADDKIYISDIDAVVAAMRTEKVVTAGVICLDEEGNVLRGLNTGGGYAGGGGTVGLGDNKRFSALSEMAHEINVTCHPYDMIPLAHERHGSKNASYLVEERRWYTPDKPSDRGKVGIHPCGPVTEFKSDGFRIMSFPYIRQNKVELRDGSHDLFDYLEYEQNIIRQLIGPLANDVRIGGADSWLNTGQADSSLLPYDCPNKNKRNNVRLPGSAFGTVTIDFVDRESLIAIYEDLKGCYTGSDAFDTACGITINGNTMVIEGLNPYQVRRALQDGAFALRPPTGMVDVSGNEFAFDDKPPSLESVDEAAAGAAVS